MIKTGDLENREELAPANGRTAQAEAQRALLARIAKAKTLEPHGADMHCRDCWNRGRNAAIRVIEGEGAP